jgi:hypothetical protein
VGGGDVGGFEFKSLGLSGWEFRGLGLRISGCQFRVEGYEFKTILNLKSKIFLGL